MLGVIVGFYILAAVFFSFAITALTSGEEHIRGHMAIAIVCSMISGIFFGWAIWLTAKELGV